MPLNDEAIQAVCRQVDALRDEIVEITRRLVRIPTVNPYSGDDSAGRETEGQALMARLLAEMGAEVQQIPIPQDVFKRCGVLGPYPRDYEDRPNVVGRFTFGGGGRSVLLNCHIDTVGVQGYEGDPFSGDVRDGRIYGRGTSDSKGNLVVGLAAVKALQQAGLGFCGEVIFESVVDEECNGSGGGTLANRLAGINADAAIVLDGMGLYVCTGCNGVITAAVDVYGKGGHAATGAVNAIDKAVAVKLAIDEFARTRQAMEPPQMVNLGVFRGGSLPAVVPEHARLEYNITYVLQEAQAAKEADLGWSGRTVMQQFEQAARAACRTDPWLAEQPPQIRWIKDLYPFAADPDEPIVRAAAEAYQAVLGEARPVGPMPAWFDAAHIAIYAGVPVVGMGAGTEGVAHSQCEYIVIEDQLANAKAVALAIYGYLAGRA